MAPLATAIVSLTMAQKLMIGGTALAGYGRLAEGQAGAAEAESAEAIARYNAALQEREAQAIEQKTVFEMQRQAERGERVMSALQAKMAAETGVTTAGTPLLVAAKQASELELEKLLIGYEGGISAQRARSQAELDRTQAKIYGRKAKSVKKAGYIGAGTTLLTGFSKTFE